MLGREIITHSLLPGCAFGVIYQRKEKKDKANLATTNTYGYNSSSNNAVSLLGCESGTVCVWV